MFDKTDGSRPWYRRLTIIGAILFGGVNAAENVNVIPPGTSAAVIELTKSLGIFLSTIGIYRHLAPTR